jgi:hypothetical protein
MLHKIKSYEDESSFFLEADRSSLLLFSEDVHLFKGQSMYNIHIVQPYNIMYRTSIKFFIVA